MYRAIVFVALVALVNSQNCPNVGQPVDAEKLANTYKIVSKLNEIDFLGKKCAQLKLTKQDDSVKFNAVVTSKDNKKDEKDVKFDITKVAGQELYTIKVDGRDNPQTENFQIAYYLDKTLVIVGCKQVENKPQYIGAVFGDFSDTIKAIVDAALKAKYQIEYSKFTSVDHSDGECAGGSAAFLVPSILTGIIMLLVTKLL